MMHYKFTFIQTIKDFFTPKSPLGVAVYFVIGFALVALLLFI